jgi:Ca2+-binding RTX toxin-like protein
MGLGGKDNLRGGRGDDTIRGDANCPPKKPYYYCVPCPPRKHGDNKKHDGTPTYCVPCPPRKHHGRGDRKHRRPTHGRPYYCLPGRPSDDDIHGGRGDDRLGGDQGDDHIKGGRGRDLILGGSGRDDIWGGRGGDVIAARDGERDDIDCGFGFDRVTADRKDKVARNCERVRRR